MLSGSEEAIHKNPSHAYAEPGLYTVTLTVGNGIDEVNTVATDLIQVFPGDALGDVLVEGFESDLDPETWTLYNHQGEYGWTATSAAAIEGDKSFYIKNRLVNIFDSKDELVSATFDMSEESSIIISYKWAFALKTDPSDDRLTVKISKDCGQTWVTKEVHRGMTDLPTAEATNTNFVPDSDEWAEETIFIDEENFLVQNFRVKFEFSGRGGNNIYLDDINIGNENDLAVEGVDFNPGLVVYPNPSSDDMNVVLTSLASEQVQLELYDLTGRKVQDVFQGRMNGSFKNELVLHRAGLASGVYVLRLSNGQSAIQEKIVFK